MLAELDSSILTGWLAYLRLDDEQAMIRMAKACSLMARSGALGDEEEVIDTTRPEFAQQFKGLIGKG